MGLSFDTGGASGMPACQSRRSAWARRSLVTSSSPLVTRYTRLLVSERPFCFFTSSRSSCSRRLASRPLRSAVCTWRSSSLRAASSCVRCASKSGGSAAAGAAAAAAAGAGRLDSSRIFVCADASSDLACASAPLAAASSRRAADSAACASSMSLRAWSRSSSSSASRAPRGWALPLLASCALRRASPSFSRDSTSCADRALSSSEVRFRSARMVSASLRAASTSSRRAFTAPAADWPWNQKTTASTTPTIAARNANPIMHSPEGGAE